MSTDGGKSILNVIPFSRNANATGFRAPETKLHDTLPTDAPDFFGLSDVERRIFNFIAGSMLKGLHRESDALDAARLAQAMAKVLRLEREIAIEGEIFYKEDIIGNRIASRNPKLIYLTIANSLVNYLTRNLALHASGRRALIPHNRRVTADVQRWGT